MSGARSALALRRSRLARDQNVSNAAGSAEQDECDDEARSDHEGAASNMAEEGAVASRARMGSSAAPAKSPWRGTGRRRSYPSKILAHRPWSLQIAYDVSGQTASNKLPEWDRVPMGRGPRRDALWLQI